MNEEVLVRGIKKKAFKIGLKLISIDWLLPKGQFKCIGYKIIDNELFLSAHSDKCEKFPYEYNLQQTIDFAWGWYEANKKPSTDEPDTDGSTKVAFELSSERTGYLDQDWGMVCSVKPIWFVYGK